MPNKEIIEQRLHFLAFDDQTFESLKKIKSILEPKIDHVLDRFFIQLFQEPELKALFPTDESIARARKVQKEHWMDILFSGDIGKAHFENAERIGRTHESIGLSLSAYLGGYCIMMNQFLRVISDHFHDDNIGMTKKIHALNKAVFLDIDSVIDSYLDAKNSAIKKVLMQAEQFSDGLKEINNELGEQAINHHHHLSELLAYTESNNQRVLDLDEKIKETNNQEIDTTVDLNLQHSKLLQESSALIKETRKIHALVVKAEQQASLLDEQINSLNSRFDKLKNKHNCHFFTSPQKTVLQKVKSLFSSH